jgi:uncharacterized protein
MDHLRFSGQPFEIQRQALFDILWAEPLIRDALIRARALDLPDWLLVSGALYNTVWNDLTGKPSGHGIKDIDLFYFDGSDLTYEAEDIVIQRAEGHFAGLSRPVEVRNQARVHLWYEAHFGGTYPKLGSTAEALQYFVSQTHAVGVRLARSGDLDLVAPFGLDDIFSLRMAPNRALDNRRTHLEKSRRAQMNWPEVVVIPW